MRRALGADIARLLDLGEAMHAESRYRDFDFDRGKLRRLLEHLIDSPRGLVLVVGEPVFGFFAATVGEMWFGRDLEANDLALYLLPDRRGGAYAARLVSAYKRWAQELGVKDTKLGVSTGISQERTECFFERIGFQRFASNHALTRGD